MITEEGNKVIAAYDGAKANGGSTLVNDKWVNIIELQIQGRTLYYVDTPEYIKGIWSPAQLQYHRDWNWLIPVVKKLLKELISYMNPNTHTDYDKSYHELIQAVHELEIERIWEEVISGIKLIKAIEDNQ